MKTIVFWGLKKCISEMARRFGGIYSLHLQFQKVKKKQETSRNRRQVQRNASRKFDLIKDCPIMKETQRKPMEE
jgi:hypothetical protein